jgi:predicted GNAT family acetyltransferase
VKKPEIRTLKPGDEPLVEAFLLPRIETSMFLLGNMRAAGLDDRGERLQGTYVAAFEGGEIVALSGHFWNGTLIVQAPVELESLWRAAVAASGRPVGGLIGQAGQVGSVMDLLQPEESRVQMDETEQLYLLELSALQVPDGLASGELLGRRAEKRDQDRLTEWRVAYSVEALGDMESDELWQTSRAGVVRHTEEGTTWVVEREGELVSTSAFNTTLAEAVQVGGVYTPLELRSRGYGRCAVAISLLDARAEGVGKSILFTGVENVPAQKAYESLGYRIIGDYRIVLLRPPLEVNGN